MMTHDQGPIKEEAWEICYCFSSLFDQSRDFLNYFSETQVALDVMHSLTYWN